MKQATRSAKWAAVVMGAGLLILGLAPSAGASSTGEVLGAGTKSSLATLHGTYQFAADGFLVGGSTPGPIAYAGFVTYDGKGGFTDDITLSINGVISSHFRDTATYTVNPDCTGTTSEVGGTVHYDYFIRPDGSKLMAIETDPGSVTTSTAYRITDK